MEKANENKKNGTATIEKNLSEQIQKLQELNTLIKNREIFNEKKLKLSSTLEEIEKEIITNSFESPSYAIAFMTGKYASDTSFRISNPTIIKDILIQTLVKIDVKILEIEQTIIKTA